MTTQNTQIHHPHQKHHFSPSVLQAFSTYKHKFIEVPGTICWDASPVQYPSCHQLPPDVVWLQQVPTPAVPDSALSPGKLDYSKGQFGWTKLSSERVGQQVPQHLSPLQVLPSATSVLLRLSSYYIIINYYYMNITLYCCM